MLRLTRQNEFVWALVLLILGAQCIIVQRAFGVEEFPGFIAWLLVIAGIFAGLLPYSRAPRDLGSAFVIILIGAAGIYFGADLTMGTAGRMGPGYFPRLLSWCIVGMGAIIGFLALGSEGPPIEKPHIRPIFFVLASLVAFGYLLDYIGLAVTAVVSVMIAAFARKEVKLLESLIFAVLISLACVLIFVYALGQPLPDCPNGFRCSQWLLGF